MAEKNGKESALLGYDDEKNNNLHDFVNLRIVDGYSIYLDVDHFGEISIRGK